MGRKDNLQIILLSSKILFYRCIIVAKNFWLKLIKKSLLDNKKRYLYLIIIGLFNFFASVPFSIIAILPLTFGTLFFILDKDIKSVKKQIFDIFYFLLGHFIGIFWWMFVPLTIDLVHYFWLIPFAIIGIPFVISFCFIIFFIIGIFIFNKVFVNGIKNKNICDIAFFIIFLLCWFLGDFVRGHYIFGGFPWMMFGHFVPYSFAIQLLKVINIDFYSILFLSLVLTPYLLFFKRKNKQLQNISLIIVFIWVLNCIIGGFVLLSSKKDKINANIIASQINYPATLEMNEQKAMEIMQKNVGMVSPFSATSKNTLVLMAENTINMPIDSGSRNAIILGKTAPNENSLTLVGGVYINGVRPYNSVYSFNRYGQILSLYKKQKLVPFGEYIPLRRFFPLLVRNITGGWQDFATDGENDMFVLYHSLPYIYPTICYESIFADYIKERIEQSRSLIKKMIKENKDGYKNLKSIEENGEIIVNITNDAWMKWSNATHQHFLMARFLAVRTSLPVVRVSNNGVSAFIDSKGRVYEKTKLNDEDLLLVRNI